MNNNLKLITNYADVKFNVDGIEVKFRIYNNLGKFMNPAVDSWLARTDLFTDKRFCRYVNGKHSGHIAMTEKDYIELKNK